MWKITSIKFHFKEHVTSYIETEGVRAYKGRLHYKQYEQDLKCKTLHLCFGPSL
jgi:hypothetical protein